MITTRKIYFAMLFTAIFMFFAALPTSYAETINANGELLTVQTLHKSGKDDESLIILFLGDGYTADEQNTFTDYATKCAKTLISTDPFCRFSNKINIYAVPTISNYSGVSGSGEPVDTYYGVTFYGTSTNFDYARSGEKKARAIKQALENDFLDNGAEITRIHVVSNAGFNFGAAPTGNLFFSFASQNTLYTHGEASLHELAHSIGKLCDEYGRFRSGPNTSSVNTPTDVPWSALLGFRGVGIYPNGNAVEGSTDICYIPTLSCIMKDTGNSGFCEVCKLELVRRMNLLLYPKAFGDYYIAEPDITINQNNTEDYDTKYNINNNNITHANGHDLEYRTIVQNLTNTQRRFVMKFEIIAQDGTTKRSVEKEIVVPPLENVYNAEAAFVSASLILEDITDVQYSDKLYADIKENQPDFTGTQTTVSDNGKSFNIKAVNIPNNNTIILALYDGDNLCEVKKFIYCGETMTCETRHKITRAKVMVWENMASLHPYCRAEDIVF